MDAGAALEELTRLSTQVVEAAIVVEGEVAAATTTPQRAEELAAVTQELFDVAAGLRADGPELERVELSLADGCVLAVRDGARSIIASTVPQATTGIVLYDLRAALRRSAGKAS